MTPDAFMRSVLQRIATGPELSKDIPREDARRAMALILEGEVGPVQAAVFLIALRMKRETDDETLGILDAVRAAAQPALADVDALLDLADPYDGYARTLPAAPFLPAVLAACAVPTVSHGVERVGPKYGVTHHQVLRAAGLDVEGTTQAAAERIADPGIGWAYVDQRAFCPKLHALIKLRHLIVKRPTLTTVEGLAGPVRARGHTHLVTGFVHKAYPRIYGVCARAAGYHSALIVRGVEGGVVPSLRQSGHCFFYQRRDLGAPPPAQTAEGAPDDLESTDLHPADFGFEGGVRPPPVPADLAPAEGGEVAPDAEALAEATAEAGRAALHGAPGPMRDALVSGAALCLWHLGRHPTLAAAADAARGVLDSGEALARFGVGPR